MSIQPPLVSPPRSVPALSGRYDAIVIGAGFGGLAAALRLAEQGVRVALCEASAYPGGCASTFEHGGHRFDAGATLCAGLGPGQLFHRWIDRHALDLALERIDPVLEFRAPGTRLPVHRDRERFEAQLLALPGAPPVGLRAFFALRRRVTDLLWRLMEGAGRGPGALGLLSHRTLSLLPLAGRPLLAVLRRYGIDRVEPLRTYLDASCQITVQCAVDQAEASLALGALDYYHRGAARVRGGIGSLAWELVRAIRGCGGEVFLADRVRALTPVRGGWRVRSRQGERSARHLIANLLPQDLRDLLGRGPGSLPALDHLAARVERGWGACMLYLAARVPPADPAHIQIVRDPTAPPVEGNHVFCSAGEERDGLRPITVSTHLPMHRLRALPPERQGRYVAAVQERMRDTLRHLAPEWWAGVEFEATASPRTFARFTRRHLGYVGGIPRRAGVRQYLDALARRVLPGLHLVGDSVFPGQSTVAAALGGVRVADRVARRVRR